MADEIHKELREVFKSDMETAERMTNVVESYNPENISDESIEVAEEVLSNIQDPEREKYVYATLHQIGSSINNQQLTEFAANKLREWAQTHA